MRYFEHQDDELQWIKIQPNPFTDQCRFDFAAKKEMDVMVTNINGVSFYTHKFEATISPGSLIINTQNWPSGIYFATFKDAQQTITMKITKI